MKAPKQGKPEAQIDTDAQDFAQEVNYAVAHGGREMHPEQHEKKPRKKSKTASEEPWQLD